MVPLIELQDTVLHIRFRPVSWLGFFGVSRWLRFAVGELSGVWVGRTRLFPPTFWMFELNTFHLREILVVISAVDNRRYYVREFSVLTNNTALVEALRDLGVPILDSI
jgi:hypothetical protein